MQVCVCALCMGTTCLISSMHILLSYHIAYERCVCAMHPICIKELNQFVAKANDFYSLSV